MPGVLGGMCLNNSIFLNESSFNIGSVCFVGNILLNIQLTESIPIKRMGKNNVSLVCIPNPPMEAKSKDSTTPTMLLIRLKTGEEADEICDKLNEFKQ